MNNCMRFMAFAMVAVVSLVFVSCSGKGDDGPEESGLSKYLSMGNATYVDGSMPASSGVLEGLSASGNNRALAGGFNIVTVTSPAPLDKFYVGVEGVNGYYEIASSALASRANGEYVYTLTLDYSVDLNTNITIIISALTHEGAVVDVMNAQVTFVVSAVGDLTVNLTFDQAKDVDLHLFMPDDTWIYYANSGFYDADPAVVEEYEAKLEAVYDELERKYGSDETEEFYIEFEERYAEITRQYESALGYSGLDHDSNAGCSLDYLNNENIVIKANRLIPGTYRVYVNMFENCSPQVNPTKWNCNVRFNGNPVTAIEGANPSSGVFGVNADSNNDDEVENMQLAVKFKLTAEQIAAITKNSRGASATGYIWAPMTESAIDKAIEGGHWYKARYRK